MLVQIKLKTSTSFRASALVFVLIKEHLKFDSKTPTHTTVLKWVHKIGFYELTKKKEKAKDWVIIIDESIQLGRDKLLVVFGIREKNIDFSRPLRFQDLTILKLIAKPNWNGDLIAIELEALKKEIGTIKYAVADRGSDIRKGLRESKIPHIHDITHRIANILKKLYKDDIIFLDLKHKLAKTKRKYSLTDSAFMVPPHQKKKARYQNISTISNWCMKIINILKKNEIEKELYEKLEWVLEYEDFINDLFQLNKIICNIESIFKKKGFSKSTYKDSLVILKELKSTPGMIFKEAFEEYLQEISDLFPSTKQLLITSDIIESAFGKYKNYVNLNPMAGITNLALCIAAFTSSLEDHDIIKSLETTTINDIKNWTKEFIGKTLFQRRNEFLCCN